MTTAAEAATAKSPLASDIAAGVNTLSLDQTVTFVRYVRLVLPVDGAVFWVKADLVSKSAMLGTFMFDQVELAQGPKVTTAAATLVVQGSLHYATNKEQNEDETIAINSVVFTAINPSQVQDFNQIGPNVMYIATFEGIRFAFQQRRPFYAQADVSHYIGNAIYPEMETQIIDSLSGFDSRQVISNSLPFWLSLNGYTPPYPGFKNLSFQLFPSFAVPDNQPPPYAAVHILPDQTTALQAFPVIDQDGTHHQLVHDTVRITLYGVRNADALTFQDAVNQYSLDTDSFGLMNMPIMRDEKRTQAELGILAMKKTMTVEISYYQSTARSLGRTLIESAFVTFAPLS
jgi:hypothetical protein